MKFLAEYPNNTSITATAKAIGVGRRTVYDWINRDELFARTFAQLKKEIDALLIEKHEQNIDELAFSEKTKDQSRIFASLVRLRALAPEKYREKHEAQLIGEIVVKSEIPRPKYKVDAIQGQAET